jgi:dihydropyrimidine dehydrogenase (NAD+) subunit PreA
MYGATALTFCTILYFKGFEILTDFRMKMEAYMDQMGYNTLADFRGAALKYIVTPDKVEYLDMLPKIDEEKCNQCGTCTRIGHCRVLRMEDGYPYVERPNECYGCGVCYWLCPKKAITMINSKTGEAAELPRL